MIELNEMTHESNMIIGPNAIIWPDEIIINWIKCVFKPNVTFESNTIIGPDLTIGPNVVLGKNIQSLSTIPVLPLIVRWLDM